MATRGRRLRRPRRHRPREGQETLLLHLDPGPHRLRRFRRLHLQDHGIRYLPVSNRSDHLRRSHLIARFSRDFFPLI